MPVPQLAAAVNGSAQVDLAPGWGWVIEASAMNPRLFQSDAGTMQLSGPDGGWASAFSLHLSGPDRKPLPLKAVLSSARPSTPTAALDSDADAEARWLVAPEDTQLAVGKYELVVTLDAPGGADAGWSGRAASPPVQLTITAPPSPVTPAWAEHERLVKSHYAQARGDIAAARAEIDALLSTQPENVTALAVKGNLQEAANDKEGALKTYELALSIVAKRDVEAPEPPTYLLHRQRELSLALGKK